MQGGIPTCPEEGEPATLVMDCWMWDNNPFLGLLIKRHVASIEYKVEKVLQSGPEGEGNLLPGAERLSKKMLKR